MKSKFRNENKINSGSMADIAFLLLIFFLVTTTIVSHQGLSHKLPPEKTDQQPIRDRNLFKILINSQDKILVEGNEFESFDRLKLDVKNFVLNNGKDPHLSVNPEKAIVSLKIDRGTKYRTFIQTLDALQGVYYEIYGDRIGMSAEEFRQLKTNDATEREKYLEAREGIPMNISIAEPTKIN